MAVCETCRYPHEGETCNNPACLANPNLSEATKADMAKRFAQDEKDRKDREWLADMRDKSIGGEFG